VIFGIATRLIVVSVGSLMYPGSEAGAERWISILRERENEPQTARESERHRDALSSRHWLAAWYRWDAVWYAEMSESGYAPRQGHSNTAFLPLLPLVMRGGSMVGLDRYVVGLIAANLMFAVGLACFGLAASASGADGATAWRACVLLCAYPYSFFFSAPYQESFGFAFMAAALLAWTHGRAWTSAGCLAMASLARLSAVAMSVGLGLEWLGQVLRRSRPRHAALAVAVAGGFGLAVLMAHMGVRFGDPLLGFKSQSAWNRQPASLVNLVKVVRTPLAMAYRSPVSLAIFLPLFCGLTWPIVRAGLARPSRRSEDEFAQGNWLARTAAVLVLMAMAAGSIWLAHGVLSGGFVRELRAMAAYGWDQIRADYYALAFFAGLGLHAWWRRGSLWGCLILVPIALGAATGNVMSMTRFGLSAFPAFLDLAELIRGRIALAIVVIAGAALQVHLIGLFVHWVFVG
jgi:hypothetical protein